MPPTPRILRAFLGLLAAGAGLSCSDRAAGPQLPVRVLLAPVFPARVPNISAALGINNFRVIIGTPANIMKDTVYSFGPTTDSIIVNLAVPNLQGGETVPATIEGRSGSTVLFAGTATVTAREAGSTAPPQSAQIPIVYVGTGARAASLRLAPRDTTVFFGDSLTYRVIGLDSAGAPLANIPLVMSASDTSVRVRVTIQPNLVRAPQRRAFAWIRGTMATGITDSTRLFFVPPPVVVQRVLGDSQAATVGTALGQAVQVRVQSFDSIGVAGVPVQFRSLSGGQVTTAIVLSDSLGLASTTVRLGPLAGPQQFDARVGTLPPAVFTATGLAGVPRAITLQAGNNQSGSVGAVLTVAPSVRVVDSLGNPVPGVQVQWANVPPGTGRPTNDSSFTDVSGVASSGGWRMGSVPRVDTLLVTSIAGSVRFVATATVAPARVVGVVSGDGQSAIEGNALPQPLVGLVVDSLGNGIAGVTVNFAASSGTVAPTSAVSTASGQVSTVWTLGLGPGTNTVTANVTSPAGVLGATFTATALPVTPTLLVSVIGSNVVGSGRTGSVQIRSSSPVPVGSTAVISLSSASSSVLTLASSTVTIVAGDSIATVGATGVSVGSSLVTASAAGYVSGTLNVPVSLNLISAASPFNVGLGQSAALPISLSTSAPAGGVAVSVVSATPSVASVVTPAVVPAGSTTASASVTGHVLGTTSFTFTNANYAPFTGTVNVTAALRFPVTTLSWFDQLPPSTTTIGLQSSGSPVAAPAPGVNVTLTSNNPACVASGSLTVTTGSTTAAYAPTYAGSAALPCVALIVASSFAGVTTDSVTITIQPKATLSLFVPNPVGRGLQVNSSSSTALPTAAHGGVTVTITSADSTKLSLSNSSTAVGGAVVTQFVPNGSRSITLVSHAMEGSGPNDSVLVTAAAPGFNTQSYYVQLRTTGYLLQLPNSPTITTPLNPRTIVFAQFGPLPLPTSTGFSFTQAIRAGSSTASRTFRFSSSTPAVGRLRGGVSGDTITLADTILALVPLGGSGTSGVLTGATPGVAFQPLSQGTSYLDVRSVEPTFVALARASDSIIVTAATFSIGAVTVGRGLQSTAGGSAALNSPAPTGGLAVTVRNPVPGLVRLSATDTAPGFDSLQIAVPAGSRTVFFYVNAIEGQSPDTTINLTLSAPGFTTANVAVNLRSRAVDIGGLVTSITTSTPRDIFQVRVGYRSSPIAGFIATSQNVRPGGDTVRVSLLRPTGGTTRGRLLALPDTSAGSDSIAVIIPPGQSTSVNSLSLGGAAYRGVAAGTDTVRAVPFASSFAGTVSASTAVVTVTAPAVFVGTFTVGRGLQASLTPGSLSTSAPGSVLTVRSLTPSKVKVSNSATTLADSATFTLSTSTTLPTTFVHALEGAVGAPNDTGLVEYSVPGFQPDTLLVFLRTTTYELTAVPTTTSTLSPRSILRVQVGYVSTPTSTIIQSLQAVRAGRPPLVARFVTTTPTLGTLLSASDSLTGTDSVDVPIRSGVSTSSSILAAGATALRPLVSGTWRVRVRIDSLAIIPTSSDSTTITAPVLSFAALSAVGGGLQISSTTGFLSAPAPAGTVVRVSSSNPAVLQVARNSITAGAAFVDVSLPTGATSFTYTVQGVRGQTGTALLTSSAPGYVSGSLSVNVVQPAVDFTSLSTSYSVFSRSTLVATVGIPNTFLPPTGLLQTQPVSAGAPGPLSVVVTSSNPGVVALLTNTDTTATAGALTLQIPLGSASTTTTLTSANSLAAQGTGIGTSVVAADIAGFARTTGTLGATVTVVPGTIFGGTTTVGAGLMTTRTFTLGASLHGGRTVTITSSDPAKLLVSRDTLTAGTASITITVANRATSVPVVMHGVEGQSGRVNVTVSAPSFNSLVQSDSIAPMAVGLTGLLTSGSTATTADRLFQVRVGTLSSTGGFQAQQAIRAGASPLTVTVAATPSTPARLLLGTTGPVASQALIFAPGQSISPSTVPTGGLSFRFAGGTGSATVTGSAPGATTSTAGTVVVTVNP